MINKVFTIRLLEDVFRFPTFKLNTDCALPAEEVTSSEDSESEIDSNLAFSDAEAEFREVDGVTEFGVDEVASTSFGEN